MGRRDQDASAAAAAPASHQRRVQSVSQRQVRRPLERVAPAPELRSAIPRWLSHLGPQLGTIDPYLSRLGSRFTRQRRTVVDHSGQMGSAVSRRQSVSELERFSGAYASQASATRSPCREARFATAVGGGQHDANGTAAQRHPVAQSVSTAILESAGSIEPGAQMDATAGSTPSGRIHVEDEIAALLGSTDRRTQGIPQLVAVAIALRHSWRMDDFYRIVRRLKLVTVDR